jgi:Tfp pilus assembly protein PilV
MSRYPKFQLRGFVLLEALIALLVAAFAIVGIVKLQGFINKSSAESVARSEAVTLMQERLERMRTSFVTRDLFFGWPTAQACETVDGARTTNTSFNLCATLAAAAGATESRAAQLSASWTDSNGTAQNLTMQSVIAWDDPLGQAFVSVPPGGSMIAPVGDAKKGVKKYDPPIPVGVDTGNNDGLKYHLTDGKIRELLDANGKVLLYLDPKNDQEQSFTVIKGRVYFDENAGNNSLPPPSAVQVRLSSEGVCVQDQSKAANGQGSNPVISAGSNAYRYFDYSCYVGPGWYGNVGVTISDSINGSAANPTICLGDPEFNNGVSNSTLVSAHSVESGTRTYRGFRASGGTFLSTGVAGGRTYPNDGSPLPSAFPAYYGTVASADNFFNHHFLLTSVSGNSNCRTQMLGGAFLRNAGSYYCIKPHNSNDPEVCPSIWPNFESQVGVGGSINYSLDVIVDGNGTVTSVSPVGAINCGSSCFASLGTSTPVELTATPASGQSFLGWSGSGCSGTGSCTLTMNAAKVVTAQFSGGNFAHTLNVSKSGSGTGVVTSDGTPSINCGSTCSAGYSSAPVVQLSATPDAGSSFTGWSGGSGTCVGSASPCSMAVSGAVNVTANFSSATPTQYTLTVVKAGSGSGTVAVPGTSPAIDCGSTCSGSVSAGTSITLTATPSSGSAFGGWSGGGCAGNALTCTVAVNAAASVTATFGPAVCTTTVSGSLKDKNDSILDPLPTGSGACSKPTNNAANFNCTLGAVQGTVVTLQGQQQGGSGSGTIYTRTVTATCGAQTAVTF